MSRPIDQPKRSVPEEQRREEQERRLRLAETLVVEALERAFEVHERLGAEGCKVVHTNRFGDGALHCDVEAERAVIDRLRTAGLPILLHSEEHGTLALGDGEPVMTAVLDGLDGSKVYASSRGTGRYGTMLALFSGSDPLYSDYLCSGIFEHSSRRLYLACRGRGAELRGADGSTALRTSGARDLDPSTTILYDDAWEVNRAVFRDGLAPLAMSCHKSSAIHYADVVAGAADLALECTRKGNLEIAVAYGLVREAGGCMLELDGRELGELRYLEHSRAPLPGEPPHRPIVTAASLELAQAIIRKLADAGLIS